MCRCSWLTRTGERGSMKSFAMEQKDSKIRGKCYAVKSILCISLRRKSAEPSSTLVQIEIADRLACGRVLGLFHGLFKFLGEDVFLMCFLEEGVRKLVLTLPLLLLEDA